MLSVGSLPEVIGKAVSGGVNMVQIREKDLSHDALMKLVGNIVNSVQDRALVAVNTDQSDHVFEGVDIIHRAESSLGYQRQASLELADLFTLRRQQYRLKNAGRTI